jgi:Na+-transporting NADH:ubiquinone oxidoreductase subunit B
MLLGTTAGCLGETSAILVILGGIYIVWKKAANYRIVVAGLLGMLAVQTPFWLAGLSPMDPVTALLSGGFLLGLFFFATEPVSASQLNSGRWIYGAVIGALAVVIRSFSGWREGMMFAILLANTFAPIMDYAIRAAADRQVEE